VVGEVGTTAPAHAEVLGEQFELLAEGLQEHLPAGRPIPPRQLALGLVALMYGGLSLSRAFRGTKLSDEVLRACRALGAFAARKHR
jgi:TetR/AcrR family transcriptional repressor of nem operon